MGCVTTKEFEQYLNGKNINTNSFTTIQDGKDIIQVMKRDVKPCDKCKKKSQLWTIKWPLGDDDYMTWVDRCYRCIKHNVWSRITGDIVCVGYSYSSDYFVKGTLGLGGINTFCTECNKHVDKVYNVEFDKYYNEIDRVCKPCLREHVATIRDHINT